MSKRPFSLFLLYLVLEVIAFILLGNWIGFGWTILLILGCSLLGFILLKIIGLTRFVAMAKPSKEAALNLTSAPVFDTFATILIIIPGIVSTLLGLILYLPFVQNWCFKHFKLKVVTTSQQFYNSKFKQSNSEEDIIEGEFSRKD